MQFDAQNVFVASGRITAQQFVQRPRLLRGSGTVTDRCHCVIEFA
jgi:hypothetical protein